LADRLSIKRNGFVRENLYSQLLDNAFNRALALDGKVSLHVQSMVGMSGRNYRLMINNLVGSMPAARYLEVGSWAGSTACSAMEGNRVTVTCIDNWSEFGGPKAQFLSNTNLCLSDNIAFTFIESDFRAVNYGGIGKYNIYLFDGPHSQQDQYDGVAFALPALDDQFVFIVDDWNWQAVRDGTHAAIAASNLNILYSIEVRTTQDNTHAETAQQNSDWHNGYFLSVLEKKR
jgi:hypothetical protein